MYISLMESIAWNSSFYNIGMYFIDQVTCEMCIYKVALTCTVQCTFIEINKWKRIWCVLANIDLYHCKNKELKDILNKTVDWNLIGILIHHVWDCKNWVDKDMIQSTRSKHTISLSWRQLTNLSSCSRQVVFSTKMTG